MANPPADVEPLSLFEKLQEVPAPSEIYAYPRKGVDMKFRMFVLGVDDHQAAREKAIAKLKAKGHDAADRDTINLREVFGDMVARELLAMAVRHIDPIPGSEATPGGLQYGRHFHSAEALGEARVTADEVAVLFTMWQLTQAKYGPYEWNIENEHQLSRWVEKLAVGASAAPLARCDWQALVESSMLLARRAFLLSACLESQRSTLPDTLASTLDALGMDTSLFGELPAKLTNTGLGSNGEWLTFDDEELDSFISSVNDESVKAAAEAAKKLHKYGE